MRFIDIPLELISAVEDIPMEELRINDFTKCLERYNARAFNWSEGVYGRWDNLNIIPEVFTSNCKKWALANGYYLRAEQGINYYDNLQWTCFLNKNMNIEADYVNYWNHTEVDAIIDASKWILKELKNDL